MSNQGPQSNPGGATDVISVLILVELLFTVTIIHSHPNCWGSWLMIREH